MKRLPDEQVNVKYSTCNKCDGIVRAAVEHEMNTISKNSFAKEVFKYNLSVKVLPLLEYRKAKLEWCKCNN